MTDFDFNPDRTNTDSLKWDVKAGELPMWVADMDFATAPAVTEAIKKRARHGVFGYTIVPDRWYDAIINWWKIRHSFKIDRDWLQFCTGVVPAISCLVKRFTNHGDNVAVLTPAYDIFYHSIENAGRKVKECPLEYADGKYSIDFSLLERVLSDPLTKLMIFCNPHNPTGNLWTAEEIREVGKLCKDNGVMVISDEIHCDLTSPQCQYTPFASVSEECRDNSITCISASKAFNIAGLQSAAVVIPNRHIREVAVRGLNSDEVAEPNCFAAEAVIAAFDDGASWLDELREYLYENRQQVYNTLEKIPQVHVVKSDATYLVWIDCSAFCDDSEKFCEFLRERTGLILSSGSEYRGNGKYFVRLNTACNRQKLNDGLARFIKGIKEYGVG